MFDLSLAKLALISLVALVVIGPEKLPKVARMVGALLGRAQRYINDVKSEVSRDMALDELHNLKREVQEAAQDIESNLAFSKPASETSTEVNKPDLLSQQFSSKAKKFRRQKVERASLLAIRHRQRHNGRSGLRTGASLASNGKSGSKVSGFFS